MYALRPLLTALLPLQTNARRVKPPRLAPRPSKAFNVSAAQIPLLFICASFTHITLTLTSASLSQASAQTTSATPAEELDLDTSLEQVSYDLYQRAQLGHVHRVGPSISPDAPGWERMTSGRGDWRPPTRSSSGRWPPRPVAADWGSRDPEGTRGLFRVG